MFAALFTANIIVPLGKTQLAALFSGLRVFIAVSGLEGFAVVVKALIIVRALV